MYARPRPTPKALFRYHVVSEVRARVQAGKSLAKAIEEVLRLPHLDPLGQPLTLFESTVRRWVKRYAKDAALAALENQPRSRTVASQVLSQKLLDFLRAEKRNDQAASVPELIRRARIVGVVASEESLDRTSVWRACRRMGLPLTRSLQLAETDMRSFAYPNRMMMVLSDGKHFRAGTQRLRRVALAFLDDATRYGLDAFVGTAGESTALFLAGLHEVVGRFGVMAALFLDRGAGFISDDTHATCGRLGVAFIHGTAGYPEGHGKIEKFNQTWKQQLLRGFDGHPEISPDPQPLRARLLHYLHNIYNKTPHEGLEGDTPEQRWNADPRRLCFPHDRAWLDECFVTTFERTVSKDNLIPYKEADYELPRGHAGKEVIIRRSLLRGSLSVLHEGRLVEIHPVDRVANAYARRARPATTNTPQNTTPVVVHTAATLAYQRELAPLVDADGGYPKGDDEP
jgi:putative transposase